MTHHIRRKILPFTAIVGQEEMKKALILNAINPRIGGVLIRGEKGTAKSTAVRALAELLPEIEIVKDCPFNCDPNNESTMCDICYEKKMSCNEVPISKHRMRVINLPLGSTEDRVVGTIDIEKAIKEGIKALEPGILADANRGVLYIDEVNLLDDHVADVLLDSSAMGVNVIEREGISVSHPSNFILVGTMNPEEGEIRPQLLDRFGLQVSVESILDAKERVRIVKAAEEFEIGPEEFLSKYKGDQELLSRKILTAKSILKDVVISDDLLEAIANTCIDMGVRSHRAEIVITRTAKTIAALDERKNVNASDVKEAMDFALPHRMRRMPFESPQLDKDDLERSIANSQNKKDQNEGNTENNQERSDQNSGGNSELDTSNNSDKMGAEVPKESVFNPGKEIDTEKIGIDKKDKMYRRKLRGKSAISSSTKGKYVRSKIPRGKPNDIAFDATIRAAAPHQKRRGDNGNAITIKSQDLRGKVREGRVASACVFVVDASGSMGAMNRMESAKGAILSLLLRSYQKRDKVGMVSFRGDRADILLPLSSSVDLAVEHLKKLPTGGRTPLSSGLIKGINLLISEKKKNSEIIPQLLLISDGHANVPLTGTGDVRGELKKIALNMRQNDINFVVIDTERVKEEYGYTRMGYCKEMVDYAEGSYYPLSELSAGNISSIVEYEWGLQYPVS